MMRRLQYHTLGYRARTLLCWLGTAGRPCSEEELCRVTGWAPITLRDEISKLRGKIGDRLKIARDGDHYQLRAVTR